MPSISPEEQEKLLEKKRREAKALKETHTGMDELASKSDEEIKESLKEFAPSEKEKEERG